MTNRAGKSRTGGGGSGAVENIIRHERETEQRIREEMERVSFAHAAEKVMNSMNSGNTAAAVAAIKATGVRSVQEASKFTQGLDFDGALDILQEFGDTRAHSVAYLTDFQKGDALLAAYELERTNGIQDTLAQNLVSVLGIGGPPQIVSNEQFDKIQGAEMYRTVYSNKEIGVPVDDVIGNLAHDEETFFSGSGGSQYGSGIYFADTFNASALFGNSSDDSVTMRFKFADNAVCDQSFWDIDDNLPTNYGGVSLYDIGGDFIDRPTVKTILAGADGYYYGDPGMREYIVVNRASLVMADTVFDKSKSVYRNEYSMPTFDNQDDVRKLFYDPVSSRSIPKTGVGIKRQR